MFPLLREKTLNCGLIPYFGPTFDNLRSFEGIIEKNSNYYAMETIGLFSGSYYNTGSENAQSIANGHNNVTDLQVYLVKGESFRLTPVLIKNYIQ